MRPEASPGDPEQGRFNAGGAANQPLGGFAGTHTFTPMYAPPKHGLSGRSADLEVGATASVEAGFSRAPMPPGAALKGAATFPRRAPSIRPPRCAPNTPPLRLSAPCQIGVNLFLRSERPGARTASAGPQPGVAVLPPCRPQTRRNTANQDAMPFLLVARTAGAAYDGSISYPATDSSNCPIKRSEDGEEV
jgi:hypothetical protein